MFPYTDQGQRDKRKKTYVRKFQEIPLHKSFLWSSWEKGRVLFFQKGTRNKIKYHTTYVAVLIPDYIHYWKVQKCC